MQNFIEIGKIISFRGLDGTLKIKTESNDTNFIGLKKVYIKNQEFSVKKLSKVKNLIYLTLCELDSLTKAEQFKNEYVFIKRENIKLNTNEYLICDMLGLKVYNSKNEFLGEITDIDNFGSKDVYTLKNGKTEITFCLIDGLFESVNLMENKIIVNSKILSEVMV